MLELNIKPLFDKVIVLPELDVNEIEGGWTVPKESKEQPIKAKVIACGDGLIVNKGDEILIGRYSGARFKNDGVELIILRESDIFAVFNK